jgi:ATP-dependent exoDNAse (exonuclease V) alpha subunit
MHALCAELKRARGFAGRTVLLIDEAGMAPTRLTATLFTHAELARVKVIAVGDPGQLGPVEAGGWLRVLTQDQPAPVLREVLRQRDPTERAALEALRDGRPGSYLSHKRDETFCACQ